MANHGHKIDIVHRDIKPENVFIDTEHAVIQQIRGEFSLVCSLNHTR